MNKKMIRIFMSGLLVLVVVAAAAFSFASCGADGAKDQNDAADDTVANSVGDTDDTGAAVADESDEPDSAAKVITVDVVDGDGNEVSCEVKTDKTVVGDALLDLGLIAGENGQYGLYVKTVNGITADYDVNGTYWAFYIDGEYAMSGVDVTDIVEGSTYTFKVEK